MARSGVPTIVNQALDELRAARNSVEYRANWVPFLPQLAETFAIALKAAGHPLGELNAFAPELTGDEIGAIINRLKRPR